MKRRLSKRGKKVDKTPSQYDTRKTREAEDTTRVKLVFLCKLALQVQFSEPFTTKSLLHPSRVLSAIPKLS